MTSEVLSAVDDPHISYTNLCCHRRVYGRDQKTEKEGRKDHPQPG